MFRYKLNELRLIVSLEPFGPLLIKAGEDAAQGELPNEVAQTGQSDGGFEALFEQAATAIDQRTKQVREARERRKRELAEKTDDPEALRRKLDKDMRFVTTSRNGKQEVYLPGSGLKGVLRTRCEQLARTFLPPQQRVCDIFDENDPNEKSRSCTKKLKALTSSERYVQACRICQIFGCGSLAGRLAVSDGYLQPKASPGFGTRSGVGINRLSGANHPGALFFYEVLERGVFKVTLSLENFELWQLGLVGLSLHELFSGALPVGYGTRRGLGRLQGEITGGELTYLGTQAYAQENGCQLKGIAALTAERGEEKTYGFIAEPLNSVILPEASLHKEGLRQRWSLSETDLEKMWAAGVTAWEEMCALPVPLNKKEGL